MSEVDNISVTSSDVPTFSIITPVYNAEATLPRTIASIMAQTEKDWELIVCDDDSQDNSVSVVNAFSDIRIKVVKNRFEKGASGARKTARFFARGLYVAYLDADDNGSSIIWLSLNALLTIMMLFSVIIFRGKKVVRTLFIHCRLS